VPLKNDRPFKCLGFTTQVQMCLTSEEMGKVAVEMLKYQKVQHNLGVI
jgi:hypothetical protein